MAGVAKTKNADTKPVCKYGNKCYRKNPQHLQHYRHPGRSDDIINDALKPTTARPTKPEKRKKEKTINDYFRKPAQSQSASDSDSQENSSGQALKKKKLEIDEAALRDKKVVVDNETKAESQEVSNEERDEDADDDISASPEDIKENIKKKFLVDMPDDFYKFWEFCQSLKYDNPRSALEDTLNLTLVGPFDILSGRYKLVTKNKLGRKPKFLLHYRYFYDPPEFQTVIASQGKSRFHLGYYRDDPKEDPVFVASNSPGEASAEKIYPSGENLFAAVLIHASKELKSSSGSKKKSIEQLIQSIKQEAKKHNLPLGETTENMKKRKKKVVCPTFHGAGIVVPVGDNDVGYRPVPETPGNLRAMFKKISQTTSEEEREKNFEELQELMTLIQFANDECDYGEGLELGLDLFSFGAEIFHPQIASLLPLAYQLLNRHEFSKIIQEHLRRRRKVMECVDELV